jgi:hypothetical protein
MAHALIKIGKKTSHITTLRLVQQGFRGGKTPRKAIIYSMSLFSAKNESFSRRLDYFLTGG